MGGKVPIWVDQRLARLIKAWCGKTIWIQTSNLSLRHSGRMKKYKLLKSSSNSEKVMFVMFHGWPHKNNWSMDIFYLVSCDCGSVSIIPTGFQIRNQKSLKFTNRFVSHSFFNAPLEDNLKHSTTPLV